MWGFLIALLSGALMSVQGVFNTGVTKQSGPWLTNCFVQFTAFLVCLGFYLFSESAQIPVGSIWSVQPKYLLTGGIVGAFITLTVIQSMSRLGPAKAVLAIVIAQTLVGYLIELFGWFGVERTPFSVTKLVGMAVAIAGLAVFSK